MPYNLNNQDNFDIDTITAQKVEKLANERMNGKFKNDQAGFAKAFLQLNETATYDKTRKVSGSGRITTGLGEVDVDALF